MEAKQFFIAHRPVEQMIKMIGKEWKMLFAHALKTYKVLKTL